jgi:hypothetical protein
MMALMKGKSENPSYPDVRSGLPNDGSNVTPELEEGGESSSGLLTLSPIRVPV